MLLTRSFVLLIAAVAVWGFAVPGVSAQTKPVRTQSSGVSGSASPNSDQVHFLSPTPMEQFAPGDTIKIRLQFEPALGATDASVYVQGLGAVQGRVSPAGFQGDFKIPDYSAGKLVLDVTVYAGSTISSFHEDRTVAVRPCQKPLSLKISQNVYMLDLKSAKYPQQLYVKGTYRANPLFPPASFERDVTQGAAGTKYVSDNPSVLTPNGDGLCKVFAAGVAVVTAENDGVKDQTAFLVEDPVHPLAPTDLSSRVVFSKSPFWRQRGTIGFWAQEMLYVQDLQITNKSGQLIVGPLYLVINGLPADQRPTRKVRLINQSGQVGAPKKSNGSPYIRCTLPGDGLTLKPGESIKLSLQFDAPLEHDIHYAPALIRATGQIGI
jgi:hypothetical protein